MRPVRSVAIEERPALLFLFVSALALLVYWPALHGTLVWDDAAHVTTPALRSWHGLARIWFELGATQQYYPVLHTAFWIEHRLWGDAVVGYHLLNVLLHAANAWLWALLLRQLVAGKNVGAALPAGVALLAACLFTVHPVAVESVAWISEQKNTLSLLFALLATRSFLAFDGNRSPGSYARASVFFALALGTKSVTAVLPAALLVVLAWRNGRIEGRRDVVPLLPWFAAAIAAALTTAWVERTLIGANGSEFDLSLLQRVGLAGRILWFYVAKTVAPVGLVFIYPHWTLPVGLSTGHLAALAALVVTAVLIWKRAAAPGLLAGWLLYAGILVPALGFINVYPFRFSYVADHFQYHALPVALTLLAAGGVKVAGRLPVLARLTAGIVVVGGLGLLARQDSAHYVSGDALYRDTLARNPDCWMAHNNLGVELARSPSLRAEAAQHYEAALALKPDYADAHNNYGLLLLVTHDRTAATNHFMTALHLQPDFFEAELNLAHAFAEEPAQIDEAIAHYRHVLAAVPTLPAAHFGLANTLARTNGGAAEAAQEYQATLRLDPGWAEAHVNYASFLAKTPSGIAAALTQLEEALRLNPGLVKAHYDLANLLSDLPDREGDARSHYEAALRLEPNYVPALNNLGILEAKSGHLDAARQLWQRALEVSPNDADAAGNLQRLERMRRP